MLVDDQIPTHTDRHHEHQKIIQTCDGKYSVLICSIFVKTNFYILHSCTSNDSDSCILLDDENQINSKPVNITEKNEMIANDDCYCADITES
ncbi:unnamed protein product [Adineta steineri]|uniref:Uncharacterized protein n=1 Tax=Adineta steineri TaxID=433720 RepID=A0A815FJX8_9BILA|nr:unnamed protein product [Adineta steineri]